MYSVKKNPKLYEINTAVWLYELSVKYSRKISIGNVPAEEWDGIGSLGFDYIWLMGIWKRSRAGMEIFRADPEYSAFASHLDTIFPGWTDTDIAGSPYSIASYDPDPIFGKWDDIEKIREHLHKRDMKLILDFVPNHTAPDHPWVYEHPEYYIRGKKSDYDNNPSLFSVIRNNDRSMYVARGRDPYFHPWTDTVQLNHFNPHMRLALINEIKRISGYCDGIRCDMAMLVLNDIFASNWKWTEPGTHAQSSKEFWEDVREQIPGLLLIAEAYWNTGRYLLQLGFDFVYDKELYDLLQRSTPMKIARHLTSDYAYQKKLVRFIENHDEPRSAEVFGWNKLQAIVTLFSSVPGMKLYHQGQLEGKKIRIPVQLRRMRAEVADSENLLFYEKLLSITGHDVFNNGEWYIKDVIPSSDESFSNLIAYVWRSKEILKLVAINVSGHYSQGRILFRSDEITNGNYILIDELNGRKYVRNGSNLITSGLHVTLDGFHAHMFDISPITQKET
jgi:hypothetical protein